MTVFISNSEMTEIAESVVKSYHRDSTLLRVDIDSIATKLLRLNVRYESIREKDIVGFTSDEVRPLTVRRGDKDAEIVFPKNDIVIESMLLNPKEDNRRRFVLAHEIGHVLCGKADPHHNVACFNQVYALNQNYSFAELKERMSFAEMQANNMAGALLMPRFVLLNAMKKCGVTKRIPIYGTYVFMPKDKLVLQEISNVLGVSHTALIIQIKKENLFAQHEMSEYLEKLYQTPNGW